MKFTNHEKNPFLVWFLWNAGVFLLLLVMGLVSAFIFYELGW